jgi:mannosyltransferase OCH1-like enzyme
MSSQRKPSSYSDILPVFPAEVAIPKVIHQIYFSPNQKLPPVLRENILRIMALNQGWGHKLYDDLDMAEAIGSIYGPRVLDYYGRINEKYGASRADFFRYLLMYRYGGVYLDIKASLRRPLAEVLHADDVYVLSRWRNKRGEEFERWGRHGRLRSIGGDEFQQWHIIAAPGHPFLRAVIERVLHNIDKYNPVQHQTGRAGVLWLTGPIAYTLAITPLMQHHRHRIVNGHDELGLQYNILGSSTFASHKSLFKYHYSDLADPVTNLTGAKRVLWFFFRPIHIHVICRIERLIEAVARRARRWGFERF